MEHLDRPRKLFLRVLVLLVPPVLIVQVVVRCRTKTHKNFAAMVCIAVHGGTTLVVHYVHIIIIKTWRARAIAFSVQTAN